MPNRRKFDSMASGGARALPGGLGVPPGSKSVQQITFIIYNPGSFAQPPCSGGFKTCECSQNQTPSLVQKQLGQKLFRDLYTSTQRGGEYRPWSKTTIVKKNTLIRFFFFASPFLFTAYAPCRRDLPGEPGGVPRGLPGEPGHPLRPQSRFFIDF